VHARDAAPSETRASPVSRPQSLAWSSAWTKKKDKTARSLQISLKWLWRYSFKHPFSFYGSSLQNSPYFFFFFYARVVKQKVWNEAENREPDWGETLKIRYGRVRLACFARVRLLRHAGVPISLLILRKKTDCFAVYCGSARTEKSTALKFLPFKVMVSLPSCASFPARESNSVLKIFHHS